MIGRLTSRYLQRECLHVGKVLGDLSFTESHPVPHEWGLLAPF